MIATVEDIKKIRQISDNIQDIRIEPYIQLAEELVIIPAIGAKLYKEIEANKSGYSDILNETYYSVDVCGQTEEKYSGGLLKAISYIAYSKLLLNQSVNVTAFGVRTMNSQFSEQAADKEVVRASNEARAIGDTYLQQVLDYINKDNQCKVRTRKRRFFAIG